MCIPLRKGITISRNRPIPNKGIVIPFHEPNKALINTLTESVKILIK
jgi:hypothetical protein